MAFGKKELTFSWKDEDGDVMTAVLRKPTAVEESEFRKGRFELDKHGRITKETNYSQESRCELFDILLVDLKGKYLDADGKKKDFSFASPIPESILKAGGASSMKDVPSIAVKEKAILTHFEDVEEIENVAKK